jgi:hypothetical protein
MIMAVKRLRALTEEETVELSNNRDSDYNFILKSSP